MLFKKNQESKQFNFSIHVIQEKFQRAAEQCGYEKHEINEKLFKKLVLDDIAKKSLVDLDILTRYYGFKSSQAIYFFLEDKDVFLKLLDKIDFPQHRLSEDVFQKIKSVYKTASEIQEQTDTLGVSQGIHVLSTLPLIFSFLQERSDEELNIIEGSIEQFNLGYLNGHSLIEFKNDLNKMDTLSFEKKYEGCFSGMLQNIIKPVIGKEEFFRWVEARILQEDQLKENLVDVHDTDKTTTTDATHSPTPQMKKRTLESVVANEDESDKKRMKSK